MQASGYAHTVAPEPLRGAPARGGGSIFLRRNGRDITFGGTAIRMSPVVAALLQRHGSARKALDDAAAEPGGSPSTSSEGRMEEAAGVEGQADLEEHVCPDPLPAGLTGVMMKGCGATEAGTFTAVVLSLRPCRWNAERSAFRLCSVVHAHSCMHFQLESLGCRFPCFVQFNSSMCEDTARS